MQLKKGTEIEVDIQHLNISGRGVAKQTIDGQEYNIAVDRVFPGDKAVIKLTKIKKYYAEGKLVKLKEPSLLRIQPRTIHTEYSGGTPWAVLAYEKQLEFKQKEVERILGNIKSKADIKPILGMEDPWFYRNKMQYSFGYDKDMNPTVGLHVAGRKFDVYDLEECNLCETWTPDLIDWFREACFNRGFLPYRFKTNEHELRDLTIRSSKNTDEAMVILSITQNADLETAEKIVKQAAREFEFINSWWIEKVTTQKGYRTTHELILIEGRETISEELTVAGKRLTFLIGPTSFFQPNTKQAEVIYNEVANFTAEDAEKEPVIYDLFCGTGTIGISLAHKAKHIYGIDISDESIYMANKNAKQNGEENTTFIAGDLFKDLKKQNWPSPDIIIIDPPRAGLQPKLIEYIAQLNPKKIIYVSCNIKTFAQDILEFREYGWNLKQVQPVDQFPHTKHLELVGELCKRRLSKLIG